jgi:hypothetical protein
MLYSYSMLDLLHEAVPLTVEPNGQVVEKLAHGGKARRSKAQTGLIDIPLRHFLEPGERLIKRSAVSEAAVLEVRPINRVVGTPLGHLGVMGESHCFALR